MHKQYNHWILNQWKLPIKTANENCQIESCNIQKLVSLYKGKGDMQNLNNWWSICCLKEMMAHIVNSIITYHLLRHVDSLGPSNQFDQEGYHKDLQSLKVVLRCQHGLLDFPVLSIDLKKAFQWCISHNMIWLILSKYGIPDETITVNKNWYEDCWVQTSINGETKNIQ